jgi:hypothetical protein
MTQPSALGANAWKLATGALPISSVDAILYF